MTVVADGLELSPKMRQALATAPSHVDGLRGLYHHNTLAALAGRGFVRRYRIDWDPYYDYGLTPLGLEVRDALRAAVDEQIVALGYRPSGRPGFFIYPWGINECSRGVAMREHGIGW